VDLRHPSAFVEYRLTERFQPRVLAVLAPEPVLEEGARMPEGYAAAEFGADLLPAVGVVKAERVLPDEFFGFVASRLRTEGDT
jgi:hypothetical protein